MGVEAAVALITVVVALVGVLISVFTLSQSARKDAFQQLQEVVNRLEKQLDAANLENKRLKEEIAEREERIEELSQRVDAQDALIASLKARIDKKKG